MKKLYYALCFGSCLFVAACKKTGLDEPRLEVSPNANQTLLATTGHRPLTVVTYAGYPGSGYKDGPVKEARFNYILGIDITDDGTIYLADRGNSLIRKIKNDIVSTVNIPPNSEGRKLFGPEHVRVQKDGTINILTYDVDFVINDKIWIVKPNGQVFTPPKKDVFPGDHRTTYNPYTYNDLEKDPYTDKVLVAGIYKGYSNAFGVIEDYEIKNGRIGTNSYYVPSDSLNAEDKNSREITSFFCAYNKVKYVVINSQHIYKKTPSGQFSQIYRDLTFKRISDLVATKDSRTIYIADLGRIKSISNNKLTYLVGPQPPFDRGDGIGSSADVYAERLALSKDESTLYFSDNTSLRQLFLR
ncbi:hypothetical protein FFF34_010095 [Inquilinus sp. KBS0705]|nr:hypothetical protein FFF34_010095 [Inquilinus sp. KBS0705]